jgi:hypothetical protein
MKASRESTTEVPATKDQGCIVRLQNNAGQNSFCSRIAFLPVAILTVLLRAALSELQQKIRAALSGLKTMPNRAHFVPEQPSSPSPSSQFSQSCTAEYRSFIQGR